MGVLFEKTRLAIQHAYLAQDVYRPQPQPAGHYWRPSTHQERRQAGLEEGDLGSYNGGFFARLYVNPHSGERCVAFRGTQQIRDWGDDAGNVLGVYSRSYHMAGQIGLKLRGSDVSVTGHSLGGGLAYFAAMHGKLRGDTFNAAALGWSSGIVASLAAIASGGADIDLWVVDGDPVTFWGGPGNGTLHLLDNPELLKVQHGVLNVPFHGFEFIIAGLMKYAADHQGE